MVVKLLASGRCYHRTSTEAVDVFNNYGAINVDLNDPTGNRTLVINKLVDHAKRLRDQ